MRCSNCSNEIPEGRKACGYCGVKIISNEKFLCPSCGEELPAGVKVCGYCGTKMEKPPIVEKDEEKPVPMKKSTQQEPVKVKQTRKVTAKTEPKKAEKKSETPPKVTSKKAGLPKWALPGIAGGVVIALVLTFLLMGSGNRVRGMGGTWRGTIEGGTTITFQLDNSCKFNTVCGTFDIPDYSISGDVMFLGKVDDSYEFMTVNLSNGEPTIANFESLELLPNGNLLFYSDGPDWLHETELSRLN